MSNATDESSIRPKTKPKKQEDKRPKRDDKPTYPVPVDPRRHPREDAPLTRRERERRKGDRVDEAGQQSFPASDPPSFNPG